MKPQEKERIALVADLRELLPRLLSVIGSVERLNPPADLSVRLGSVRTEIAALLDRARRLEEATDCMPAADRGRMEGRP